MKRQVRRRAPGTCINGPAATTTLMRIVRPANKYVYAADVCILTSYFNPTGYSSKLRNYRKFIAPIIKGGLHHVVVECSFNNGGYEIPEGPGVVRVNANDILWQKERLLNIALQHVPSTCTKVVWIDSDILFANPRWAVETSALLDDYHIVQPYEYAIRLPRNRVNYTSGGLTYNSFALVYNKYPNALINGNFNKHGHTGFVWAGRKDVFEDLGFYDACLSGVADHLMAHSFCGDWHSPCLQRMFLDNKIFFGHYEAWSKKIFERVQGRMGCTPGTVLHLWHGEMANRRYLENMQHLAGTDFDPAQDLALNDAHCWELRRNNGEIVSWTKSYFTQRQED